MFRVLPVLLLTLFSWTCSAQSSSVPELEPLTLAETIAAEKFGALIERLSGDGGYFDTDNLISNESSYLHVIPRLNQLDLKGGAYIGVGPDQNFSYIAHLEPTLAIILDIRRDNMLTHLFYKALFELSGTRMAFLNNLFARDAETKDEQAEWSVHQLLDTIESAPAMSEKDLASLLDVIQRQVAQFGIALNEEDYLKIREIHVTFIRYGPSLRFTSHGRAPQPYYPTYRELAAETTVAGENESFLGKEIYFQRVKKLQEANKIVPVVGNFAGPHALPEIGAYLKEVNLEVAAFYTSNVEFYLMRQQQMARFADNVRQLPLREGGVFIRSYFNRWSASHRQSVPGYGSTQLLQYIRVLLDTPAPSYSNLVYDDLIQY